jgi:hypothetical protein
VLSFEPFTADWRVGCIRVDSEHAPRIVVD